MMKLIFGWAALLIMANTEAAAEELKVKLPKSSLTAEGGRFVFGQISDFRRDQYMLDTKTGRLWQTVETTAPKNADGTPGRTYIVLQEISYSHPITGKESAEPPQR